MSRQHPPAALVKLSLLSALLLCGARAAHAAPQTFVSAKGDDANACGHAAPCRTFAGALPKTDLHGEVVVLDAGEYGPVAINNPVRLTAVGVYAGITVFDGSAVTLAPPLGSVVALRGLTITSDNGGLYSTKGALRGIEYLAPGPSRGDPPPDAGVTLHVENCTISGFLNSGIHFKGQGDLHVKDTTVRDNRWVAIELLVSQGSRVRASIVNSRFEGNYGAVYASAKGEGEVEVTARDTVAAGNYWYGFTAVWPGVRMSLHNCVVTNQGLGVQAVEGASVTADGCLLNNLQKAVLVADSGIVRLSNTTITNNHWGIYNSLASPGSVHTFGNNRLFGNKVNSEDKPSFTVQQF